MPGINFTEERDGIKKRRENRGRNESTRAILKSKPMNKCKKRKDTFLESEVHEVCTFSSTGIKG